MKNRKIILRVSKGLFSHIIQICKKAGVQKQLKNVRENG